MINRQDRNSAASLVEQLRDGTLSNLDFEEQWPQRESDRALAAISSMLWHYYDDLFEHRLTEAYALTGEAREIFDRCALFLLSDLEYLWPRDDFFDVRVNNYGSVVLGLSDPCYDFPDCDPEGTGVDGDIAVWPFFRVAECDQMRRTEAGGSIPLKTGQ